MMFARKLQTFYTACTYVKTATWSNSNNNWTKTCSQVRATKAILRVRFAHYLRIITASLRCKFACCISILQFSESDVSCNAKKIEKKNIALPPKETLDVNGRNLHVLSCNSPTKCSFRLKLHTSTCCESTSLQNLIFNNSRIWRFTRY